MKQIITKSSLLFTLVAVFALIFSSCSTSESVVTSGFLQKRKYNKGFHKSIKKNHKVQGKEQQEELVLNQASENSVEPIEVQIKTPKEAVVSKTAPVNSVVEEVAETNVKSTTSQKEEPVKEHKTVEKLAKKMAKVKSKINKDSMISSSSNTASNLADDMMILLIVLAIILPFVAVGIYTDWDPTKTLISVLLWLFFILPGVIYALLVIFDMI
ncbi:MAG: YqaE/Pmp3 family membrane protein [Flavobacteriales bacterium]|jgi:uncharacterized membrane protein YqaE (UPF0057 family)|nr:YqaE/Pmp3 family membrane protein [Flavobacteriales bacterium]